MDSSRQDIRFAGTLIASHLEDILTILDSLDIMIIIHSSINISNYNIKNTKSSIYYYVVILFNGNKMTKYIYVVGQVSL